MCLNFHFFFIKNGSISISLKPRFQSAHRFDCLLQIFENNLHSRGKAVNKFGTNVEVGPTLVKEFNNNHFTKYVIESSFNPIICRHTIIKKKKKKKTCVTYNSSNVRDSYCR